ncbi:MAG: TetR/AcrR family transcriptional regulator [Bacteroidales bacterium]|jgi:AcrR family transcriptional regulator|nr:TetR/AcrR family transcriptional regulator [Bacteroidales bacterium]
MPRTTEQYEELRNEKKQLIANIALKLFANQGYTKTSISAIAKEANISKGLMYNYFQSKKELLEYITNSLSNDYTQYIDPNKDGIITDEEALNYIDITFTMLKERREALKDYYQLAFQPEVMEIWNDPRLIHEDVMKQRDLFLNYWASKFPDTKPEIAKANIIAFIKGFVMLYVYMPEMYPDDFLDEYKTYLKQFITNQTN